MAVVTCPECGRERSDQANACQGCGKPFAKQPEAAGEPPASTDGKVSPEKRKAILAQVVSIRLARPGEWRVETQSDFYAVVVGRKPVNHILHLLLSVFTLGFWLIVWLAVVMTGSEKRYRLSVDEYGNGTIEKLGAELVDFWGAVLALLGCGCVALVIEGGFGIETDLY